MNAILAALLITSSWVALAYSAISQKEELKSSKIGLSIYALGTFLWSLKGVEINDISLILISALQTISILLGVILL
jgi:hypothetical protein